MQKRGPNLPNSSTFQMELEIRLKSFIAEFLSCLYSAAIEKAYSKALDILRPSLNVVAVIDNASVVLDGHHKSFADCKDLEFSLYLAFSPAHRKEKGVSVALFFSETFTIKELTYCTIAIIHENENLRIPSHQILSGVISGSILFEDRFDRDYIHITARSFIEQAKAIEEIENSSQLQVNAQEIFVEAFRKKVKGWDKENWGNAYDPILDEIILTNDLGKPFLGTSILFEQTTYGQIEGQYVKPNEGLIELNMSGPFVKKIATAKLTQQPNVDFDITDLLFRHVTLSHELAHRYLLHSTSAGCAFRAMSIARKLLNNSAKLPTVSRNWLESTDQKLLLLFEKWHNLHERLALAILLFKLNEIAMSVSKSSPILINCDCDLIRFEKILKGLKWPLDESVHEILLDLYNALKGRHGRNPELYYEIETLLYESGWHPKKSQLLHENAYIKSIQIIISCLEASSLPMLESDFLFTEESSFKEWLGEIGQDFEIRWEIFSDMAKADRSPIYAMKYLLFPDQISPNEVDPFNIYRVDFFWSRRIKENYREYFLKALDRCPSPEFSYELRKHLKMILQDTRESLVPLPGHYGNTNFLRIDDAHPLFSTLTKQSTSEKHKLFKTFKDTQLNKKSNKETTTDILPPEYDFVDLFLACAYYPDHNNLKKWVDTNSWPELSLILQQGHNIADILQAALYGQIRYDLPIIPEDAWKKFGFVPGSHSPEHK